MALLAKANSCVTDRPIRLRRSRVKDVKASRATVTEPRGTVLAGAGSNFAVSEALEGK
jgi:hypothetical protein